MRRLSVTIISCGGPDDPFTVEAMERIKEQHLQNILGIGLKQNPSPDETALRYFLATVLLRHYLGTEWCDDAIGPCHPGTLTRSRADRLFLRTDADGDGNGYRNHERIERLAELLYNLQEVRGMAGRHLSIQGGGQFESTYAELEFAGHFIRHGVRVVFRNRSGVRGNDYDFDANEGGTEICCEVKCKLENSDLNETTILNTLDRARKQTPSGRPAIIGVKIPEPWISEPGLRVAFESALASTFRNSDRVVAVIVRWEEVSVVPPEGGVIAYKFHAFPNHNSQLLTGDVEELIQRLRRAASVDFKRLRQVVFDFCQQQRTGPGEG